MKKILVKYYQYKLCGWKMGMAFDNYEDFGFWVAQNYKEINILSVEAIEG